MLVLAAMPREVRPLARTLRLRSTELCGSRAWCRPGLTAATLGVGPARARQAAGRLLDETGASEVLVIGVAGACTGELRVADVVAPAVVVDAAAGTLYTPAPRGDRAGAARSGTLATVERLGAPVPPDAIAVDMETAAVAAECVARDIAWDVRRAVSDVPGSLPDGLERVLRPDGTVDAVGLARMLGRRPASTFDLARLGWDTRRALKAMTVAAERALGAIE